MRVLVIASLLLTLGITLTNRWRSQTLIRNAWSQQDGHACLWESYGHRILRMKRDDCTVLVVRISDREDR